MNQQLEHHIEALEELCDEDKSGLTKPLKDQEHPLCVAAPNNTFYNVCELMLDYKNAKAQKQKSKAIIMQYDFKPHFQTMLVQCGETKFKGVSKIKASEKILSFVRATCDCAFAW